MLSRAAERVYWAGRYLERAENSARIVQQYSQLLLDLPEEAGLGWGKLVQVFGAEELFESRDEGDTETNVLRFLLSDPTSSVSLAYSISLARENIRNTRDLLPQESWECVNELHQFVARQLGSVVDSEDRFEFLAECIGRCLQVNGILTGTMSHTSPYHFLRLGQNIERADMTSRIIDVATAYLHHNEALVSRYGSSLWTNVLKSVSGFQMYRQYCQPQVEGNRVVGFLMHDTAFPRALAACINRARYACRALPRGEASCGRLDAVETALNLVIPPTCSAHEISEAMDGLQLLLADVHQQVRNTWFLPGDAS